MTGADGPSGVPASEAEMTRRILIDRDRCIGSGNCCFVVPGTFDLDEELKSVSSTPVATTRATSPPPSKAAPSNAIGIIEDDD